MPTKKGRIPNPQRKFPPQTVVVLGTTTLTNGSEYRVGIVGETDYEKGLHGPNNKLNPVVTERCFGHSPIFHSAIEAEAKARSLYESLFKAEVSRYLEGKLKDSSSREEVEQVTHAASINSAGKLGGPKVYDLAQPWPA